jgi:transcriptional regulator with XRE-family HTH domain
LVLQKNELGKLIKKAREHKSEMIREKYTQEMLANDIGLARSSIGDFESGRKYPKYDYLAKIADACEVSLSFFGEEEEGRIYYSEPAIFEKLPDDLKDFVAKEESTPYLVVAQQLASYDLDKISEKEMKFLIQYLKMAKEKIND